jgi:hypothetical protein
MAMEKGLALQVSDKGKGIFYHNKGFLKFLTHRIKKLSLKN